MEKNNQSRKEMPSISGKLSGGLRGLMPGNENISSEKRESVPFSEKGIEQNEKAGTKAKKDTIIIHNGSKLAGIKAASKNYKTEASYTIYIDPSVKRKLQIIKYSEEFLKIGMGPLVSAIVDDWIEENRTELEKLVQPQF